MGTSALPATGPVSYVAASDAQLSDDAIREHLAYALRLAMLLDGDASSAEDVAAEAVAKLLVARRRVRVEQPTAYVRRIVVNSVLSRRRRRGTERRFAHRVAVETTTPDLTDRVAVRNALDAALHTLTERQRAVLVLRYYEDLPVDGVAALLGISVGTVKSTASHALDHVRRHMSQDGTDG